MAQSRILRGQDGLTVILEIDGKYHALPYSAAKLIGKELISVAAAAEEFANAAGLIQDQAILIKSGFPIGLTSNPKIIKEALKVAEDIKIPNAPPVTRLPKTLQVG